MSRLGSGRRRPRSRSCMARLDSRRTCR